MITNNIVEIHNPNWQDRAKCTDTDPAKFFSASRAEAKAFCKTCPVAAQCLEWILKVEAEQEQVPSGIYAATTPAERRRMKLCKYRGCYKVRDKSKGAHFHFCSEEHHQLQRKLNIKASKQRQLIKNGVDSPINPREYHMKGRVRSA